MGVTQPERREFLAQGQAGKTKPAGRLALIALRQRDGLRENLAFRFREDLRVGIARRFVLCAFKQISGERRQ